MKKFFLSLSVIAVFVFYSFVRQGGGSAQQAVTPLVGDTPTPSPEPSPTSQPHATSTKAPSANNPTQQPQPTKAPPRGQYKDGTYTGNTADAFYGNIQVQAIVSGGKLTDVRFLQYPNDRRTSIEINTQAMPMLRQEAIQAQSANVNIISGASDTSAAFIQSLGSALSQAKS